MRTVLNVRFHTLTALATLLLASACTGPVSDIPYFQSADGTPVWLGQEEVAERGLLRVPDFELVTQTGEAWTTNDTRGRLTVIHTFFSSCTSLCPSLRSHMGRVYESFPSNELQILSMSVDSETDTPDRLASYASMYDIDAAQWKLLTGGNGEREHTEDVWLVDADGYVRGIYNGSLALELDRLIEDARLLL